jgi:hypothetical protein
VPLIKISVLRGSDSQRFSIIREYIHQEPEVIPSGYLLSYIHLWSTPGGSTTTLPSRHSVRDERFGRKSALNHVSNISIRLEIPFSLVKVTVLTQRGSVRFNQHKTIRLFIPHLNR